MKNYQKEVFLMIVNRFIVSCLIAFFVCNIFPAVSLANITKTVDDFDGLTRIVSVFKDTDRNLESPFFTELYFQKAYKNGEMPEYILVYYDQDRFSGAPLSSMFSDTCIRFNRNPKDAYRLTRKASREFGQGNTVSYTLTPELIDKILKNDIVEIKTVGVKIKALEERIRIVKVNTEILKEWRQVITQN